MSAARKITLKSSDGETFEVEEAVALESQTIKHMIEDDCADNGIPLPNVTSKILFKVIEYCQKHVEAPKSDDGSNPSAEEELKLWDAKFVKVDQATLVELKEAANYLNIKSLLDLTVQTVPDMMKGKTLEEIDKILNDLDWWAIGWIMLRSSDEVMFMVEEAVALELQTIKHMIDVNCANNCIPLPNVTSKILSKVIEYCKKHLEAPKSNNRSTPSAEEELKSWDAKFVKVDLATLFNLILAANYLNIKSLLHLTCQTVADMIKGKTSEEIRKIFNIKNDFRPEEDEEVRRENQWAFE